MCVCVCVCVCVCQDIVSTLNCANSRLFVGFVVGCFLSVRSFFLSFFVIQIQNTVSSGSAVIVGFCETAQFLYCRFESYHLTFYILYILSNIMCEKNPISQGFFGVVLFLVAPERSCLV